MLAPGCSVAAGFERPPPGRARQGHLGIRRSDREAEDCAAIWLEGLVSLRRSGVAVVDRVIGGMAPGLPLVLAGPPGCGRTVLALQLAAAALADSDIVAFLSGEPAPLLVRQAESLGIALEPYVRSGQLLLLELDPSAPASLQSAGGKAFVDAIRREHPSVSLIVIDPFTALTPGLLEEAPLRALARDLITATPHATLVLTVETERPGGDAPVERVLAEVCGTLLTLGRRKDGRRTLRVVKTRAGAGEAEAVEFRVGASGAELVREIAAGADAGPATRASAAPTPPPAAAAPPAPPPTAAAASPAAVQGAGPARILVVDPDAASRAKLAAWLEERYAVSVAREAIEALTLAVAERPDAIVLALPLPRLSGYQLIESMHRVAPSMRILVAIPEIVRAGDRLGPLVLGAADVISRPLQRFELLHKVETLLRLSGPPPRLLEPGEAQALFGLAAHERVLAAADFRERLARALDFGERFGVPSTLLAIEAPSADVLDRIVTLVDEAVRFEDALVVVSKRRALALLVAAECEQGPRVMERLHALLAGETGTAPRLRWRAIDAAAAKDAGDWRPLFQGLADADDGSVP
jgi:CheY-like chemotaxis protein/KaiC/GvpD/RAD55 family RecA-like ATPase